jgi:hypothetical protein
MTQESGAGSFSHAIRHQGMGTADITSQFLTSAQDLSEWLASRFKPGRTISGTFCIGLVRLQS